MGFKALFAAVALFALPGAAFADEANETRLARELTQLLEAEQMLTDMFGTLAPLMAQSSAQSLSLSPSEVGRFQELLIEELNAEIPNVMNALVRSYVETLSEQELTDIVAFLRSPSGQAMRRSEDAMKTAMEREGQTMGIQAATRSLTRLMQERRAR